MANLDDHFNYGSLTVKESFYLSDFLNLNLGSLRKVIDIRFKDKTKNQKFYFEIFWSK